MKTLAVLALVLAPLVGCVDGLQPEEIGIGRRVGLYPGEVAAVLPPLTDEVGNLYVVTGQPDSTGSPQPGTAHSGGARGGWSAGCATGTGTLGCARGWIGASAGHGWLWTKTAIVELDVATGTCATKLDSDPVSASDVQFLAAAPLVDESVSGRFAIAILTSGAEPTPHLATIDLDLGLVRASTPLPGAQVFAVGADADTAEAAFLVSDASGAHLLVARAHTGIVTTIPVGAGLPAVPAEVGELAFGSDGSIAGNIDGTTLVLGTRGGVSVSTAPFSVRTVERDDAGQLWLAGTDAAGAKVASVIGGTASPAQSWTCAAAVDQALSAGVVVIDERSGDRTATKWHAHSAYGASALLPMRSATAYAGGARAVLGADPSVDRGGIPYSQLAVVPVGVEFP
jgi:hypothetical protein